MTEMKPWYLSRTIWASLIAVLAALASGFGYTIDAQSQADVVGVLVQVVGVAASLTAVFGRIIATDRIV